MELADIKELFASIIGDLTPKQDWVLPFKEVNRFLLLQKAIESKESSSVCQEVLPHLYVLKENLKSSEPNSGLSVKVAREIQEGIRPFAEKLPKLVKALNDYALLCEKYSSDSALLKRLVFNIRLFPLAEEANKQLEKSTMPFTIDAYWDTAEMLYKNSLPLFDDHPFHFSVVRAFLDEAILFNKLPALEIVLPESLSLPSMVAEEPIAIVEAPAVVAEEPIAIVEAPAVVAEEPIAVVEAPAVVAEEPIAVVEAPAVVAEEPIAVVEAPAVVAEEPIAVVEAPAVVAEEPIAVVEAPSAVAEKPIAVVEAPSAVAEKPIAVVEKERPATIKEPVSATPQPKSKEAPKEGISRKKVAIMGICLTVFILLGVAVFLFFFLKKQNEPNIVSPPLQPAQEIVKDSIVAVPSSSSDTLKAPVKELKPKSKDQTKNVSETPEPRNVEPKVKKEAEVAETSKASETTEAVNAPKGDTTSSTFDALLKKAKSGNGTAQYQVGQCYEKGTGVTADLFEAITWYRKAKVNGSKPAEERLVELGY